jgi:hypothetical protein
MELEKSSDIKIQVMEKGTNTDPINITTQEDANPVEVRISSDVEVQTMENPSVLTNRNSMINKATQVYEEDIIPKVNQENTTSMIRKDHVTMTPYRHPNHKSQYLNQSVYQHRSEQKQLTYIPKNINASIVESHNKSSSWESYKCNVPQRIELGWLDPLTIRQFCSMLRRSYRLVSSTITNSRMKNHGKAMQFFPDKCRYKSRMS